MIAINETWASPPSPKSQRFKADSDADKTILSASPSADACHRTLIGCPFTDNRIYTESIPTSKPRHSVLAMLIFYVMYRRKSHRDCQPQLWVTPPLNEAMQLILHPLNTLKLRTICLCPFKSSHDSGCNVKTNFSSLGQDETCHISSACLYALMHDNSWLSSLYSIMCIFMKQV